ncbi:MAG TPA: DUF2079 domain-containing protein [Candidatus Nitrosocosmicus sp.]|nr:DUF2079 domain-containing protein [Candidatus Nitrosocosmicus sp.]
MKSIIERYKFESILVFFIISYILFFSWLTIFRYQNLQSHYYDLGIMDQTVYNTSQGRILELTSKDSLETIKRMSIHNDILLAALAPFYHIHTGPETLLVLQTIVLALGAIPLYLLALRVTKSKLFALIVSSCYLLYPPLERSNIYDFHIITFATTFLLFAFFFAYVKRYIISFIFILLALSTKENVGLTTMLMGGYIVAEATKLQIKNYKLKIERSHEKIFKKQIIFGISVALISLLWFILSFWVIIPSFREGQNSHFAVERYQALGDSPGSILKGIFTKPDAFFKQVISSQSLEYFITLFSPLAFLSLFGIPFLLIATPDFVINILSNDSNMRNIFFHYTALLTPFIFISAIFGANFLVTKFKIPIKYLAMLLICAALISASKKGPLPFSAEKENIKPISTLEKKALKMWRQKLNDENIIVTSTGHLAPLFTQREVFYLFSDRYQSSDYVLVRQDGLDSYPDPEYNIKVYEKLKNDKNFSLIYNEAQLEVYKRINSKL